MKYINVGDVARATEVTVETVRYYEKKGLIDIPRRSDSGYRQYPEDTIKRVKFIQHAKAVGFTLSEIGELLAMRNDSERSCADVKSRAEDKIKGIDQKIEDLQQIKAALLQMTNQCPGAGPISSCPILELLEL